MLEMTKLSDVQYAEWHFSREYGKIVRVWYNKPNACSVDFIRCGRLMPYAYSWQIARHIAEIHNEKAMKRTMISPDDVPLNGVHFLDRHFEKRIKEYLADINGPWRVGGGHDMLTTTIHGATTGVAEIACDITPEIAEYLVSLHNKAIAKDSMGRPTITMAFISP